MTTYHYGIEQGSPEWHDIRQGVLTSTAIKTLITPTGKLADNDKTRAHVYEVAAQRINGRTEPSYLSFDMMRGHTEEILARDLYSKHYAPVTECGFITNDSLGFMVGYSPDGIVGEDGLIEIKSAKAKIQVQRMADGDIPTEHIAQVQTGLWVTGRKWCDFISYSNGMAMMVVRVFPDTDYHALIEQAAQAFEGRVSEIIAAYKRNADTFHIADYIEPITDDIQIQTEP
jgi:predicted phage-related endonuclease